MAALPKLSAGSSAEQRDGASRQQIAKLLAKPDQQIEILDDLSGERIGDHRRHRDPLHRPPDRASALAHHLLRHRVDPADLQIGHGLGTPSR